MGNFGGSTFTYSRHKTGPGKVAVNGHTKNFADVKFINSSVFDRNRWAFQS